ncbi:MAG: anti-sigma factor [Pseudomonadota bacterium]
MDYAKPSLAEALAQQYAVGTLRGGARRRYEALLPGHPLLRDALTRWQDRLMPLTAAIAPQTPPPRVWLGIEQRLWPTPATSSDRWWQRLALWRGVSALASAATLGLALLLVLPGPAQPPVVVVLQGTGGAAQGVNSFVASVSADGRALVTRPLLTVSVEANRVLELWSVPPEGAPRSLGLIAADGPTVIDRRRLPASLLKGGTAALAVSVEPPGGSPTGAPTGPVVYAGKLQL